MQLTNAEAEQLVRAGADALGAGHPAEARASFERVTQSGRANSQIWLLLAMACRAQQDWHGEEAALEALLAQDPRMIRAHIMRGDCRAQAGDERAALASYESARLLAAGQQLPTELASELSRMEDRISEMRRRMEAAQEAALVAQGLPPGERSPRFQASLDIISGRKRVYVQEPTGYYFPELPQIQFYERERFGWVSSIEAAAPAIREELRSLLAAGSDIFRPYLHSETESPRIDGNELLDSPDWSALFLIENGVRDEDIIARCPRTCQAVQAAPQPLFTNSPTVMFSLLKGGARITPHTGMYNIRLICHLPLIVPPGCGFRVGNDVREWEEGKLLIFDDTIEHEAWNDSNRDRVILIFDVWRPELSEQERREVSALFRGPAAD